MKAKKYVNWGDKITPKNIQNSTRAELLKAWGVEYKFGEF